MNITTNNEEFKNRKFELEQNSNEYLKDLTNYIPNLLTHLWENPKFVSKLLSNSSISDIKNHLASFIVNNFYDNILSSNSIENNLIYVFTLMLKDEINNLNNVNEPEIFLNNSPCSYLLHEITKKDNIRQYFKKILLNIIENIEAYSSDKCFNLNIKKLHEYFEKNKQNNSNEKTPKKIINVMKEEELNKPKIQNLRINNSLESINRTQENINEINYTEDEIKSLDNFTQKYVGNLTIKDLKNMISENYNKNKNMNDYCTNQLINCGQNITNRDFYSNKTFMENLYCTPASREILFLY